MIDQPLAFVDIETSGSTPTKDGITEIAVIRLANGQSEQWSTLVNPGMRIPPFIQSLTGIDDAMVADAPSFERIAKELRARLEGCVFVAHNVRFDYAFIKQAYASIGEAFHAPTLCTVRLSRLLFPDEPRHNLDALVQRHGLVVTGRHRAMADADLILQFWMRLLESVPRESMDKAVRSILGRPSLPPNIDPGQVADMPNGPGVYLFYGENDLPLYIGKSKNLRGRVLSHFSSDTRSSKALRITQQVKRVEWRETAGEVSALLLESDLVKKLKPTMNRRLRLNRAITTIVLGNADAFPQLQFSAITDAMEDPERRCFGLFETMAEAQRVLRQLADDHELCKSLTGLEKARRGHPCFGRQLYRCRGACESAGAARGASHLLDRRAGETSGEAGHGAGEVRNLESLEQHRLRLELALTKLRVRNWPFSGPALLTEGDRALLFNQWAYLGSAGNEEELLELLRSPGPLQFDRDTYRILLRVVGQMRPLAVAAHGSID
ncbi:MAG: hypothetical protein RL617_758 [Pseudomonadota bacterium]